MSASFKSVGLDDWIIRCLTSLGIKSPTPIQEKCIPVILKGHNCIGRAATGTGKTASFALPMIQSLMSDPLGIFGVVLTPTRELALQIAEQFQAFGNPAGIKIETVIGGVDIIKQTLAISHRPHFIIATPGRLAEILRSNSDELSSCFKRLKFLVLDEADRLFEQSFAKDLSDCINMFPPPDKRQTLLFTATLTPSLKALATKKDEHRPTKLIEIDSDMPLLPTKLKERYIMVPFAIREAYLYELLMNEYLKEKLIIIFVNRQDTAETITNMLKHLHLRCTCLHSQQSQKERLNSLGRFKAHVVNIFIATDVASRGLDIPAVEVVINYDIPKDPTDYVHRVGRTARATRAGEAINLVTPRDVDLLKAIETKTGTTMEAFNMFPIEKSVLESLNKVSTAKREATSRMIADKFFEKNKRKHRKKDNRIKPKKTN